MSVPVLSREQARRVYDRIGARQDTQAFYEDRATDVLDRGARVEQGAWADRRASATSAAAGCSRPEQDPPSAARAGAATYAGGA